MANLTVKLNRIKDENKKKCYYIKFKSKELNGEIKNITLEREYCKGYFDYSDDNNFDYEYDYWYYRRNGKFYDLEKLEERFPNITKAEVLEKNYDSYGHPIFVLDYITECFFKKKNMSEIAKAYSKLKNRKGNEFVILAKNIVKLLKQKEITFKEADFISDVCSYCSDEYDMAALKQGIYILRNNIRATKVRYCYGASCIWRGLGFKVIKLAGVKGIDGDNSANYAFLTEREKW